jgi:hypothetical protein
MRVTLNSAELAAVTCPQRKLGKAGRLSVRIVMKRPTPSLAPPVAQRIRLPINPVRTAGLSWRKNGRRLSAAKKGLPLLAILGGGLACALVAASIFFLVIQTEEITGRVSAVSWERSIPIEALAPVEREAWRDEIPAEAEVRACSQDHRSTSNDPETNSQEVCGTPYTVDTGSGFGEVVQDCVYEVYDDRCTYTVMDWTVFDVVTLTGTDLDPSWPEVNLAGDQRQGESTEEYVVTFSSDGEIYSYAVNDASEFSRFDVGSTWILAVNALGGISSVEAAR